MSVTAFFAKIIIAGKLNITIADNMRSYSDILAGKQAYSETLYFEIQKYEDVDFKRTAVGNRDQTSTTGKKKTLFWGNRSPEFPPTSPRAGQPKMQRAGLGEKGISGIVRHGFETTHKGEAYKMWEPKHVSKSFRKIMGPRFRKFFSAGKIPNFAGDLMQVLTAEMGAPELGTGKAKGGQLLRFVDKDVIKIMDDAMRPALVQIAGEIAGPESAKAASKNLSKPGSSV